MFLRNESCEHSQFKLFKFKFELSNFNFQLSRLLSLKIKLEELQTVDEIVEC